LTFRNPPNLIPMYKSIVFSLFVFMPCLLFSQIRPFEGSSLHYRLIGFSFPPGADSSYTIQIAEGVHYRLSSFDSNIVVSGVSKTNRLILEVPAFGKDYTWRVLYKGSADQKNMELHHFSTMFSPSIDEKLSRLRVIEHSDKFKDDYVFIDESNAFYDMNGSPVWFLQSPVIAPNQVVRDMKLSPQGTITLLYANDAFVINYNGDVLWKGHDNGAVSEEFSEHYHHEFTELRNHHYMVLGNEAALCKVSGTAGTSVHIVNYDKNKSDSTDTYKKIILGTLIEYDECGDVVWSWKSSKYFIGSDVDNFRANNCDKNFIDVHENAFSFDEKTQCIYISFKGINRIVKIKYPEGTVLNSYGQKYEPDNQPEGKDLFCGQHSCFRAKDGTLIMFDNNVCSSTPVPHIIAFREPQAGKGDLKKIWDYKCQIEDNSHDKMEYHWSSGGDVMEMPDEQVFACMGGSYSKLFIIGKDEHLLWSALPEKWDVAGNTWVPSTGYRASIVTDKKAFEALVWKQQLE